MKKSVLAIGTVALFSSSAFAVPGDPPTLNITTNPSGTVYTSVYPTPLTITVGITMNDGELKNLARYTLSVNGNVVDDIANPYTNANVCFAQQITATTLCAVSTAVQGSLATTYQVPGAGQYSVSAKAYYRSTDGTDSETVNFIMSSVEYPAPPAVANAYINKSYPLSSKGRGCVISQVADKHAKMAGTVGGYGPKGGPYDANMIMFDVQSFAASCPR